MAASTAASKALHIDTGALQQGARAVLLAQHGHQDVLGLDVGVVIAESKRLRLGQRFLEFGCQFVKSHGRNSVRIQLRLRPSFSRVNVRLLRAGACD